MEWSNDDILEFIELHKNEPCIWNPRCKERKSRNKVCDAWERIQSKFSLSCTIEELKKKRNSLLAQYRHYIRKMKDLPADDTYRPTWFAFDPLDSYMGPLYRDHQRSNMSAYSVVRRESRSLSRDSCSMESRVEFCISPSSNISVPVKLEVNSPSASEPYNIPKRRKVQDPLLSRNVEESSPNQCDLYGQLLAARLKSMTEDDRLVLMNEIDNLVFKFTMDVRKRNNSANK